MSIIYKEFTGRLLVEHLNPLEQRDLLLRTEAYDDSKFKSPFTTADTLLSVRFDYQGFDFSLYQQGDNDVYALRMIQSPRLYEAPRKPPPHVDPYSLIFLRGALHECPSVFWDSREWLEANIECHKVTLFAVI